MLLLSEAKGVVLRLLSGAVSAVSLGVVLLLLLSDVVGAVLRLLSGAVRAVLLGVVLLLLVPGLGIPGMLWLILRRGVLEMLRTCLLYAKGQTRRDPILRLPILPI
jgi:hypothetical protein